MTKASSSNEKKDFWYRPQRTGVVLLLLLFAVIVTCGVVATVWLVDYNNNNHNHNNNKQQQQQQQASTKNTPSSPTSASSSSSSSSLRPAFNASRSSAAAAAAAASSSSLSVFDHQHVPHNASAAFRNIQEEEQQDEEEDEEETESSDIFRGRSSRSSSSSQSQSPFEGRPTTSNTNQEDAQHVFVPHDVVLFTRLGTILDDTARARIQRVGTPQQLAYQWLETRDSWWPQHLATGGISQKYTWSHVVQRYALATVYFSTSGPSLWRRKYQWLHPDVASCQWGNDMSTTTLSACGSQGELVRLHFRNNQWQGPLPPELGLLTSLQEITITNTGGSVGVGGRVSGNTNDNNKNNKSGSGVGGRVSGNTNDNKNNNKNNRQRDLSAAFSLTGALPVAALGKLTQLQILDLTGNTQLVGQIPELVCSILQSNGGSATVDCRRVACWCCTTCPTRSPTFVPTPVPTPLPTPVPTPLPTPLPTPVPTPVPTDEPLPVSVCSDQGPQAVIELRRGEFLCSPNQVYQLGFTNGDFVLLDTNQGQETTTTLWSAGISNGNRAYLQGDGNFVVYNDDNQVVFGTRTAVRDSTATQTTSMYVRDAGVAEIVRSTPTEDEVVWTTAWFPPLPPPVPLPVPDPTLQCRNNNVAVMAPLTLAVGEFVCSPLARYRLGVVTTDNPSNGGYLQLQATSNNNAIVWTSDLLGHTPIEPPTSHYQGCFRDNQDRYFDWKLNDNVQYSVQSCSDGCAALGYPYFGLQHYGECFCGTADEFTTLVRADDDGNCDTPCTVNPAETCGGAWLNSVYEIRTTTIPNQELVLQVTTDGTIAVVDLQNNNNVLFVAGIQEPHGGATSLVVDDLGVASVCRDVTGCTWSTRTAGTDTRVGTATLDRKIMTGYQGWFFTYGDRGTNDWQHWSRPRNRPPQPGSLVFDMWPDLSELEDDEKFDTNLVFANGTRAGVFSSYLPQTVERHTRWMQDYGLDGVFVQRFVNEIPKRNDYIDQVLKNVRLGCEKYGRAFVNMYDIAAGLTQEAVDLIIEDWKHLVDNLHVTKSNMYLHHHGEPLVAIWGIGFFEVDHEVEHINELLDFFQNSANGLYHASVMAGVPVGWRDLTRDTKQGVEWQAAFRRFDVLSPWTVGRYGTDADADRFRREVMEPDLRECEQLGIEYLPVAYPGFSQSNLKPDKLFNGIPRNGGTFFWRQLHNIMDLGNTMLYVAMFDEVDEATAIFKVAAFKNEVPIDVDLLTLNDDPCFDYVPNDWYLQLTGSATQYLREGRVVPQQMPRPGSIMPLPPNFPVRKVGPCSR